MVGSVNSSWRELHAGARTLAAADCRDTERDMPSATSKPKSTAPSALSRARRAWKECAATVSRGAMQRHRTRSAWLADHAGRRERGVKAADQLARLVQEMDDAGFSVEEQDAALITLVRGIRSVATGTRPAA